MYCKILCDEKLLKSFWILGVCKYKGSGLVYIQNLFEFGHFSTFIFIW
jgi:hypothetical protein